MLDDLVASLWADGELVSRVTAKMWKSDLAANKARMTAPPCLPVAPVIRIDLLMMYEWV
jgi:hypothetical protein